MRRMGFVSPLAAVAVAIASSAAPLADSTSGLERRASAGLLAANVRWASRSGVVTRQRRSWGRARLIPTLATVAKGCTCTSRRAPRTRGQSRHDRALADSWHPTHHRLQRDRRPQPARGQRSRLSDGEVQTILSGTLDCDPCAHGLGHGSSWARRTVRKRQLIEIIRPLQTTDVTFDHTTGLASGGTGSANVVSRRALDGFPSRASASTRTAPFTTATSSGPAPGLGAGPTSSSSPRLPGQAAASRTSASRPSSRARSMACVSASAAGTPTTARAPRRASESGCPSRRPRIPPSART